MIVEHNQSANNPAGVNYANKWKFNGKELDDATGMYYYGARYYDPRISIFVSVDPLAEKTMTSYQYVHNNPINLIDPTGMSAEGSGDGDGGGWWSRISNGVKSLFGSSNQSSPIEDTVLDEVVVSANRKPNWIQRNFSKDKLSNDWNNIKEKSGWNHLANYYDTHDFGLPGVALGGGGSNLYGTQGKPRRDVPWVDVDWLIEIMGALKVGAPSKVPGAGSVHTPDTFGRHGKDTNMNLEESKPTPQSVELIKFTKKWYINNGGHFKRSKEAAVRVSKDTMIDPATREHFEKLNKEDSLRNTK